MRSARGIRTACAAFALSITIVACSGDSPTSSGEELTDAEFADLMEVLAFLADTGLVQVLRPTPVGPALQVFTLLPTSVSCPLGGSVHFEGRINEDDLTGWLLLEFRQSYDGCSAAAPSSNRTFVLNGDLSYDLFYEIVSDEVTTLDLNQTGTVSWATGEKSGSCQVDITIVSTFDPDTQAQTGSVSGSLCGRMASNTVQF